MEQTVCKKLAPPLAIAITLWLIGGFLVSKEVGMVCVILGIAIAGWGAGNVMNSECSLSNGKE